ncbi:carboxypeptidase-like regulatory domain-containing protein [Flavobacterium pedocola]
MKQLILFIFILKTTISLGQIKAKVVDQNSLLGIPFVNIWVENTQIGTTANEKGEFIINTPIGKTIVLSSVGYETKKINITDIPSLIKLTPKVVELNEIIIASKKGKTKNVIGKFEDSEISYYYAANNNPEIKARFFPFDPTLLKTPFLNKIKLRIYSDIKNAKFNIRLYSCDSLGMPGYTLSEQNIIGIVKKGVNNIEIDLSDLNIMFPKEGLFVSYEWLIIDENEFKASFQMPNSKERKEISLYEPKVGLLPAKTNMNSWTYKNGVWQKEAILAGNTPTPYLNNYGVLAVELTLTD